MAVVRERYAQEFASMATKLDQMAAQLASATTPVQDTLVQKAKSASVLKTLNVLVICALDILFVCIHFIIWSPFLY